MLQLKRFSRHLLLAWIIACAPVLPAFAAAQASAETYTSHHAPAAVVDKADVKSHCASVYQDGQSQCCTFCTLQFTDVHTSSYPLEYSQSLQLPVIPHLHSQWIADGHNRPPSA